MEKTFLNLQDVSQDETETPFMANNDAERLKEEDQSSIYVSGFKKEPKSVNSKYQLMFITKQPNGSPRCNLKSHRCHQNVTIQDYISFLSFNQNLTGDSTVLLEYVVPNSSCRMMLAFKISTGLYPNEFLNENFKYHRRSKSTTSLGDQFCTSERQIFGLVEGTVDASKLLKSSLFFQLATIDGAMGRIVARDLITRLQNSFNLANSPPGTSQTLSHGHQHVVVDSTEDPKDSLKMSEKYPVSCAKLNLKGSYLSTSSVHSSISKGLLHCIWKTGAPHFVFMVGDNGSEIYVANPYKIKSSIGTSAYYMYLFRSMRGSNSIKEFKNYSNNASEFVGRMKVSSSPILDSNRSKVMEMEFVLFGADRFHSKEMPSSVSNLMKNKGLAMKVAKIFTPRHSFKHKSNCVIGDMNFQVEDFLQSSCPDELNANESSTSSNLRSDFPPNLELCTIIIKDNRQEINAEGVVGGWGLKFLERIADDGCHKGTRDTPSTNTSVLVPAGFHGGPTTRTGGPSSLIERWRSGGHCDCGGWDTGCPLTVLDDSIVSEDFQKEREEDHGTINLFIKGATHDESTFKLVKMKEGVYNVYFRSTLSALQSFAIGVAVVHNRTPSIHLKL